MKKILFAILMLLACVRVSAQKEEITKTGLNIGPLPAVAYDADKGLQLGAIIQLFDYGDGSNYPNYDAKTYFEYSHFFKGSNLIQVRHDNKVLIPGVRWSSSLRINLDKAYDFYGFNGYRSYYDYETIAAGKDASSATPIFSPFYRYQNNQFLLKSEFIGGRKGGLQWEAGIFANYIKLASIDYDNVNKGKAAGKEFPTTMPTLFDIYKAAGAISEDEADGGLASGVRVGLLYDTRDKEGAPTRGIWAEAHLSGAIPGISETPYLRWSATWRQYFPLIDHDVLTLAYRLNYEGNIAGDTPFYALPFMTAMGERCDFEGMGGYNTVRGIMRTRAFGLDMATYNAELRWRFAKFRIGKQNIALGLSAFSDGTMVTRQLDMGELDTYAAALAALGGSPASAIVSTRETDAPHITFGAGFRFIMNENFIVAAEYGTPLTHFLKNSPLYNQDGTGAFYVNIGYLF